LQAVAVKPVNSLLLVGGKPGPHKIQGIGPGFIPAIYRSELVDKVIQVTDEQAISYSWRLAKEEGLLSAIPAGVALYAALQITKRPENADKLIVMVQPGFGERYLSTTLFKDPEESEWLTQVKSLINFFSLKPRNKYN
jgi:cysteine synthase A